VSQPAAKSDGSREDGFTELSFPRLQSGGIQMLKAWQGPFESCVSAHGRHLARQSAGFWRCQCGLRGRLLAGPRQCRGGGNWSLITELAQATQALRSSRTA
jgi:2-dehydro-3-deoxyphosphogluconate aldolase/(4S)-4-hydroxy-2-oxoglutarate aldolase